MEGGARSQRGRPNQGLRTDTTWNSLPRLSGSLTVRQRIVLRCTLLVVAAVRSSSTSLHLLTAVVSTSGLVCARVRRAG
jgi:hypothetical protein